MEKEVIEEGVKGVVLIVFLVICSVFTAVIVGLNGDLAYFASTLDFIIDNIGLFVLFKENESLYNGLCGCLCNKCCFSCIYGSKYKPIATMDEDEDAP